MEKYNLQEAREEADKIKKLVADGMAKNYKEANALVDSSNEQKKVWEKKWSTKLESSPASNFVHEVLPQINVSGKDVLDLGAGDGKDSIEFAKHGYHVTSVDFSSIGISQLEEAAKKLNLKVTGKIADLEKLELPENSYDVIYSNLGLHFFDDKTTRSIFTRIHKALRKNGMIFINAKAVTDDHYGKGEQIGPDTYKYKGQLRHFFSDNYMRGLLSIFKNVVVNTIDEEQKLLEGGTYKASYVQARATK